MWGWRFWINDLDIYRCWEGPEAMFRTQLARVTLRIEQQPTLQDVLKDQQHLQAEVENIASATSASSPGVREGGQSTPASTSKPPMCKYF